MTTGAELLDLPLVFEFEGTTYKVSRTLTQEMEQMLCDWVYQQAVQRIERQRELARRTGQGMTEEQYSRSMDRIADNQSAGKFDWEGSLVIQALQQWPGNKYMTWLRFLRYDPKIPFSLIEKIFESAESVRKLGLLLNPTPAGGSEQNKEPNEPPAGT